MDIRRPRVLASLVTSSGARRLGGPQFTRGCAGGINSEKEVPRIQVEGDGTLVLKGKDQQLAGADRHTLYVRPGWSGFLPWKPDRIGGSPKGSLPSARPTLADENV